MQLNDKIKNLEPYEPERGNFPIRLDANESFLPLPEKMQQRLAKVLSSLPLRRYPDPLAEEVCCKFADFYGISPSLVCAGNGSDELISVLCGSFTKKGDRVVVIEPDFSMYRFYTSLAECEVVSLQKGQDMRIDPDQVIQTVRENGAKMLLFSNPCNPTSLGLSREEVRRILRGVGDTLVVLDEAYMDFWDQSLLGETDKFDHLVILRTCSKMLGLAGLRLGFAVAQKPLIRALRACKSPYNVGMLTQAAGAAVLSETVFLEEARRKILNARDELYTGIKALERPGVLQVFPTCTNFVFCRLADSLRVFEFLKQKGILIRRIGKDLRITAGTKEENALLLRELQNALEAQTV